MPSGLLLIDKLEGQRSTDCVSHARRALSEKVGHAGTLDSTASGLLLLLAGAATRLSDMIMALPKVYRARLRLGMATDTCDASGQPLFEGDIRGVSDAALDRVLPSFWGWRMQRPPRISAVKLKGQPSHQRARNGEDFTLAPRPVLFRSVRRTSPVSNGRVEVEVLCGKGTYVRSLARDLGEALGCGACVEALRRLSIGPFRVEDAVRDGNAAEAALRPPREVVRCFHRILLNERAEARLLNGLPVPLSEAGVPAAGMAVLKGLCLEGRRMVCLAERWPKEGRTFLRPQANIPLDPEGPGGGA